MLAVPFAFRRVGPRLVERSDRSIRRQMFKGWFRELLVVVFYAVSTYSHSAAACGDDADTPSSARELLQRCLETQRETDWIAFQANAEISSRSGERSTRHAYRVSFRRQGELFDVLTTPVLGVGYSRISKYSAQPYRIVCTAESFVRKPAPGADPTVTNTPNVGRTVLVRERQLLMNGPDSFGPVDGYLLCPDGRRAAEELLDSHDVGVLLNEAIDGNQCALVIGSTPSGTYKLWLDAQCGALPRKAQVHKGPDDINWDGTKVRDTVAGPNGVLQKEASVEVYDVVLSQIGETWVPTRAKLAGRHVRSNGEEFIAEWTLERHEIEFSPNFAETDAFDDTVLEKALVVNLDDRESGVEYEIRDGKVQRRGSDDRVPEAPPNVPGRPGSDTTWRTFLVAVNGVIVLVVALWFYFRRR